MNTYLNKLAMRNNMSKNSTKTKPTTPFLISNVHLILSVGYCAAIVIALVYFSITGAEPFQIIALTCLLAIVPVFFLRTEYGILTLIVLRPIIDTFSSYSVISIRSLSLNMNAILGVAVLVWAAYIILKYRIELRKIPGMFWIVGLLLVTAASMLVTIDLGTSITELLRFSSLFVFYIIGYHITQRNNHFIVWVINALAASAVVPILVGVYQLISFSGLSAGGLSNRIYATFGHPNVLGFYMVLVITIVLIKYISTPLQHRSLLYPWVLAGATMALLFTYTRGAWLGLVVVFIVIGIVKFRKALGFTVVGIMLLFGIGSTLNAIFIDTFNINLTDIQLISRFTTRDEESDSIAWRLGVLETMAPKTLDSPLLGYGIGNFVTLRKLGDIGLYDDPEAHNDYLRIAIETGLLGLAVYVLWIANLVRLAVRKYLVMPKRSWQQMYALGLVALVLAFYAMSIGDNILQGTPVMWSFMLIVGSFLAIKHPHRG